MYKLKSIPIFLSATAMQRNTLTLSMLGPITDRLFITNSEQSSVLSFLIYELVSFFLLFVCADNLINAIGNYKVTKAKRSAQINNN